MVSGGWLTEPTTPTAGVARRGSSNDQEAIFAIPLKNEKKERKITEKGTFNVHSNLFLHSIHSRVDRIELAFVWNYIHSLRDMYISS